MHTRDKILIPGASCGSLLGAIFVPLANEACC